MKRKALPAAQLAASAASPPLGLGLGLGLGLAFLAVAVALTGTLTLTPSPDRGGAAARRGVRPQLASEERVQRELLRGGALAAPRVAPPPQLPRERLVEVRVRVRVRVRVNLGVGVGVGVGSG